MQVDLYNGHKAGGWGLRLLLVLIHTAQIRLIQCF